MITLYGVLVSISTLTGLMNPPIYPKCHEDEVIVQVTVDPVQDDRDLVGTFGCVPADNLPVTGFRP